jgi:hypothetical protein
MKICSYCHSECNRLRKTLCNTCYTRLRLTNDVAKKASKSNVPAILTEQQSNLMIGSLLGDGHLRKRQDSWNASMAIQRVQSDLDYLKWEAEICSDLITPAGITLCDRFDIRTNKTYHSCKFDTRALVALNQFHKDWYLDKIKVVPNSLQLNAEIIAIWFCDDGTISTSSNNRFQISFATNSFTKDETHFLRDLLSNHYNEYFIVGSTSKKDQFIINGSDSAARTLLKDIDPVFPQGMQRKRLWDDPTTCFYDNVPVRRESSIVSSESKRKKIVEYLKTHNEFYLFDLGEFAGFGFIRGNGTADVATTNLRKCYLGELLSQDLIKEIEKDNTRKAKYRLTDSGIEYFRNL